MDIGSLIIFLAIGALAGWLAGQLVKGHGFGLLGNMVVGVVGALLGGFLFTLFGLAGAVNIIGELIVALVGAVVLLYLVGYLKRKVV